MAGAFGLHQRLTALGRTKPTRSALVTALTTLERH